MLKALDCREPDHVPLSFMIYTALRKQCNDDFEFVDRQLEMGLDATVRLELSSSDDIPNHRDLPGLPIRYDPDVEVDEWVEEGPGQGQPNILHKEYHTPAGVLSTVVNQTEDWPYGDHVPLLDDYLCPRSQKYLVEKKEDLEALRYLLTSPSEKDIDAFQRKSEKALEFADDRDLLVTGGRGVGMDASAWLCGFRNVAIAALRRPDFVESLAKFLHSWNRKRMRVFLDTGVDLFVRRGWYEGTDFWSPKLYRRFIFPYLKKEIEMTHRAGAKFGYIMTSGSMPLLEMFVEAGLDVLIGIDPVQGRGTDLSMMKRKLRGKICLWGGVNGFITMETGSRNDVTRAVMRAVKILGPSGGFILSPVDNVRDNSPATKERVQAMIEEWKRIREYPIK